MAVQGQILPSSLSCKSHESLDSGIFSRQKSCESIESLGLNGNIKNPSMETDFSSADEVIPPLPIHQYEDYIRECQDIQQSIIIRNKEEGRPQLSRSNSLDDQEDDMAAEWLQIAGLSDLVTDPTLTKPGKSIPRESLSSMTVLLTLTRPQREAVLRRITSFNRAHMNKKPAKPALRSVFPELQISPTSNASDKEEVFDSPKKSPNVNETPETSPKEFAELTPFIRPRASSSPFKLSSSESSNFNFSKPKRNADRTESGNSLPAKIEVTLASSESLPLASSIKPSDDAFFGITSRTSSLYPAQQNAVASAVSMPNLNIQEHRSQSEPRSSLAHHSGSENNVCSQKPPEEPTIPPEEPAIPPVKMRSNSVSSDRKKKALSDIPSFQDLSPTLVADDPARLALRSDGSVKKYSKSRRKSSKGSTSSLKSIGYKSPIFTFTTKKNEVSPRSMLQQNNLSVTNSPELKKRFLLSPGLALSLKRRSPTNSPLKAHRMSAALSPDRSPNKGQKKKQSPLRKLSSISIPSLNATPKRSGSYKIKQSAASPRKSLRRSRSLKLRDKPPISVASMKAVAERKKSSPLPKKAPSIETLSISSKFTESSWKTSKDNVSLQSTDECRSKGMSFSAEAADNETALPNFSLVRDRLGITKTNDLSWVDMRKVQSLALIELTALFDIRGIELKRRKTGKNKLKESNVFGTPLTTLVDWDKRRTLSDEQHQVPMVMSEIISFLEQNALKTEGILRKCGSTARMKRLKEDINARFGTTPADLPRSFDTKAWADAHPHDVATILKQFLRELPNPLLTSEYIDAFQSCRLIPDRKEQLQALNLLVILLNDVHRDCLKLLLKFLSLIVANEEQNKMSLNNVAMITAPNLFITTRKSKKELKLSAGSPDLKLAAGTSNIVRMLIKYHKLLWVVPAFMLTQVRHMNKAERSSKKQNNPSKDKLKMKLFQNNKVRGTNKSIPFVQQICQPFDCDTPKGLIRVQAPNMNLTSVAVQLTNQLTASDVIAKYRRQNERMQQAGSDQNEISTKNYALYEVGGNLYERCLDSTTFIAAILQVNPEASWVIRPKHSR